MAVPDRDRIDRGLAQPANAGAHAVQLIGAAVGVLGGSHARLGGAGHVAAVAGGGGALRHSLDRVSAGE